MGHAQISAADPKGQLQPGVAHSRQKQQIPLCSFQRAQEIIPQPQACPQNTGQEKAPGPGARGSQENRRCIKPPFCLVSS